MTFLKSFVVISLLTLSLASHARSAVVVIDMQPNFFNNYLDHSLAKNKINKDLLIVNIIDVLKHTMEKGLPVLLVEYKAKGSKKTFSKIRKVLKNYPELYLIKKTTNGLFYDKEIKDDLVDLLSQKSVSNLLFLGVNGRSCVEQSIVSAIANGYYTSSFPQGVADLNSKEMLYPYYADLELSLRSYNFKKPMSELFQELQNFDEIEQFLSL